MTTFPFQVIYLIGSLRCRGTLVYIYVIMGAVASQFTSLTIVYSTVYSGTDQRNHQSSASLAIVRGIHWWPVNSPHKRASNYITRKMLSIWWRHHVSRDLVGYPEWHVLTIENISETINDQIDFVQNMSYIVVSAVRTNGQVAIRRIHRPALELIPYDRLIPKNPFILNGPRHK